MYTSIPLADWLLDRCITITGTIQTTRKVIPKELRETSKRDTNSYEVLWDDSGKLVLNSYVVNTKSTGKRNVMVLTTVKPILGTSKHDPKLKPAIYKQYDYTKGGTDIINQRMSFYSCKAKSRRWTMTGLAYILDTCRGNTFRFLNLNLSKNPRKENSFDFGMSLVLELVRPFISMRSTIGLQKNIVQKIQTVLGVPNSSNFVDTSTLSAYPTISTKRRRCEVCKLEIAGQPKKRDNMTKVLSQCQRCGKAICQKHSFRLCDECD